MSLSSNWIRRKALESIFLAKSGHPGGVLSVIDILFYLFTKEMNYDPDNFETQYRDRFILSKGHSAPALSAIDSEVIVSNSAPL